MVDNVVLGVGRTEDHTLAEVVEVLVSLLSRDHLSVWPQVVVVVVDTDTTTTKMLESPVE
jgi:hypothetical protein